MRYEEWQDGILISYCEVYRDGDDVKCDENGIVRDATEQEIVALEAKELAENEEETKSIPVSALTELKADLENPAINSISELKSSLNNFISKIE